MASTILIIDDSSVTRKLIKRHLSKGPYGNAKILEAADGKQALGIFEAEKIDLILSDWNMPKMNGLEFVKSVRQFEGQNKQSSDQKPVQIVMVTTEGTIEKVTQAMESGVNEYIVKPFTADTLTKTLKKVLPIRV